VENGFFKEEGLEVELIKCDWKTYKDCSLGSYDFTQYLVTFSETIEQGLDVKFLAVHTGCLRVQVPTNSLIKSVADLRADRSAGNGDAAIYLRYARCEQRWPEPSQGYRVEGIPTGRTGSGD
jgi:hypothetical protein